MASIPKSTPRPFAAGTKIDSRKTVEQIKALLTKAGAHTAGEILAYDRLVLCVNFCAGLPNGFLESALLRRADGQLDQVGGFERVASDLKLAETALAKAADYISSRECSPGTKDYEQWFDTRETVMEALALFLGESKEVSKWTH